MFKLVVFTFHFFPHKIIIENKVALGQAISLYNDEASI